MDNLAELIQQTVSRDLYKILRKCYMEERSNVFKKDLIIYCPPTLFEELITYSNQLQALAGILQLNSAYIVSADSALQTYKNFNMLRQNSNVHRKWLELCWMSEVECPQDT